MAELCYSPDGKTPNGDVPMHQLRQRLITEAAAAIGSIRQWKKGAAATTGMFALLATTLLNDFFLNNKGKFSTSIDEMLLFENAMKRVGARIDSIDDLFDKVNGEIRNLLAVAANTEDADEERAILFCRALKMETSCQIEENRETAA